MRMLKLSDDALRAHRDARFEHVETVKERESRCYKAWRETWKSKDGKEATPVDVAVFRALPPGQEVYVTARPDGVVVVKWAIDTGD